MPWSRSASPARPGCRSAGTSSGKSAIVSEDRWAVCVCVCVCLRVCLHGEFESKWPSTIQMLWSALMLLWIVLHFLFLYVFSLYDILPQWLSAQNIMNKDSDSLLILCVHHCSSCIMRHFSPLCSDSMLLLVEGVDVLPSPPLHGAGCHVVAVVSSFQGASWRPVLRHRDTHQRLSHGNGLSSTFRLFQTNMTIRNIIYVVLDLHFIQF